MNQHADSWFEEALNAASDLILIKGPKSRILWANDAFLSYYGMTSDELTGLFDGPQSDPDDTLQYVRDDQLVFDSGEHLDVRSEEITAVDGTVRDFRTIKSPIIENGQVVRSIGISRPHVGTSTLRQAPDHATGKLLARPFRQIVQAFPVPLLLVDARQRVVAASPAWSQHFGDPIPVDGGQPTLVDLGDGLAVVEKLARLAVEQGSTQAAELEIEGRSYGISANLWHYDPEVVGGVLVVASETTEHVERERELQAANERYDLVLKGASVGIWDWKDVNKSPEYWSPRFYELLGYENEEIPATLENFGEALHPDDQERTFALVDEHLAGTADFDLNYRLRNKDGSYRWYRGTGQVSRDAEGNPKRMVGSIQDIDARLRAQQDLRELNDDLTHFVHVAAHDLREPSRRQLMLTDLILDDHAAEVSPELHDLLTSLQGQARQVLDLVSAFRTLTNIDGPSAEREDVELGPMIDSLLAESLPTVPPEKVTVDLPERFPVYRTLVEMLYRNLFDNVAKHGPPDAALRIGHRRDADVTVFFVESDWSNDGQELNRLLQPFVRGDGGTEGYGMGLSICRRVARRHGGSLWIEAVAGMFSVNFTLEDPS